MQNVWVLASVWVGLALIATLLAIWFKISTALSEIVVGTVAQLIIGVFVVHGELGAKTNWITFPARTVAIVLTFLAGAELDPQIFRLKWRKPRSSGSSVSSARLSGVQPSHISFCTGLAGRVGWRAWRSPQHRSRLYTP